DVDHPRNLIEPVLTPKVVSQVDHPNWNAASASVRQPFLSGTYVMNLQEPWRAWMDEILAISTVDGPATVWRFCHTRTPLQQTHPPHWFGWDAPRVNGSPDGHWAAFTSNWELTLGEDLLEPGTSRQDVFLVELL